MHPKVQSKNSRQKQPLVDKRTKTGNVSKLYKAKNKNPTFSNTSKFKKAQQKYEDNCLTARTTSWRNFQSGIDNIQSMNTYRKITEGNKKVTLGTLAKEDGSIKKS